MTTTATRLADLASGFVPCNLSVADAIELHKAAIASAPTAVIRHHAIFSVTLASSGTKAEAVERLRYLEASTADQWEASNGMTSAEMRLAYIGIAARQLDHYASR